MTARSDGAEPHAVAASIMERVHIRKFRRDGSDAAVSANGDDEISDSVDDDEGDAARSDRLHRDSGLRSCRTRANCMFISCQEKAWADIIWLQHAATTSVLMARSSLRWALLLLHLGVGLIF